MLVIIQSYWKVCHGEGRAPDKSCSRAGICERQGFQYASGVYHYAMALALAADGETSGYHGNQEAASAKLLQAESHLRRLKVPALA